MTFNELPRKSNQRKLLDTAVTIKLHKTGSDNSVGTVLLAALETELIPLTKKRLLLRLCQSRTLLRQRKLLRQRM